MTRDCEPRSRPRHHDPPPQPAARIMLFRTMQPTTHHLPNAPSALTPSPVPSVMPCTAASLLYHRHVYRHQVLDSPFSRLTDLMLEIVEEQRLPIPRPIARLALSAMKRSVQKRAGFDIYKVCECVCGGACMLVWC